LMPSGFGCAPAWGWAFMGISRACGAVG
jgi:hypothetical protein